MGSLGFPGVSNELSRKFVIIRVNSLQKLACPRQILKTQLMMIAASLLAGLQKTAGLLLFSTVAQQNLISAAFRF